MRKVKRKIPGLIILAIMVFCMSIPQNVYADSDQTEPNPIRNTYTKKVDGKYDTTFYNVDSSHFADSTKWFYHDLLGTGRKWRQSDTWAGVSISDLWTALAIRLDPSGPQKSYDVYGELTYRNNGGKDEFYTHVIANGKHHYVLFKDLGVIALMPDASVRGNYISSTMDESPGKNTKTVAAVNDGNSSASVQIDESESGTVSMSNSVSGSESYSFSEGIEMGAEANFLVGKITEKVSFSATQALQEGWSTSSTQSQTYSKGSHVTKTIPPYTKAIAEHSNTKITVTTRYNCPVALSYTVVIYTGGSSELNVTTWDDKNWNGKKYTFGPDARKDLYQRWKIDGDVHSTFDPERIDWRGVDGKTGAYTSSELKRFLCGYVPMSSSNAVIVEGQDASVTNFQDFIPIYPLNRVKLMPPDTKSVLSDKISYDNTTYMTMHLKEGESTYTRYFNLAGLNYKGGDYYGFNKDNGYWIIADQTGKPYEGDTPAALEKTGESTSIKAVRAGTCYLRYMINENAYLDPNKEGSYTKNSDLEEYPILKLEVEGAERQFEITGSYTGKVGAAPESIEEYGKLEASILDSSGKEVDEPYIWDAKQLPKHGINLSTDGMISFTRPGTFQVRIMTPDRQRYSDWYNIKAEVQSADEKLPDIVDDADYQPVAEGTGLFIEGSFEGSANGEEANLEADGKLTVTGEDYTGNILPVNYVWEAQASEGIALSSDGKVTFTDPGDYNVRVRSGDVCSDWITITAKEPAQVLESPQPNDQYDTGETVNLLSDPGLSMNGEMAYAVVKNDGETVPSDSAFEKELPEALETGTYYVWHKALGDDRHGDSETGCVKVVISDSSEYRAAIKAAEDEQMKLKSVTAKKGHKVLVKWKKSASASGYQLAYCTKPDGRDIQVIPVEDARAVKKVIKNLKKGKRYYFMIRSTKVLFDPDQKIEQLFYGKWSETLSVKVR